MACYDFPELVAHDPDKLCGRYVKGGICRPLPTPVEPYTDEEREVVKAYQHAVSVMNGKEMGMMVEVEALGATIYPGEEIHD